MRSGQIGPHLLRNAAVLAVGDRRDSRFLGGPPDPGPRNFPTRSKLAQLRLLASGLSAAEELG